MSVGAPSVAKSRVFKPGGATAAIAAPRPAVDTANNADGGFDVLKVRHGFSLVEVLVAISIIVILAGMITLGFRAVGNKGREDQTNLVLNNAKGLTAEWQAQTKSPYAAAGYLVAPAKAMADDTMLVDPAVLQSSAQLAKLSKVAAIRDALAKMPSSKVTTLGKYGKGQPWPADDAGPSFRPGQLRTNVGKYVCLSATSTLPPGAAWGLVDASNPVLLDGWDNAVLFVPADGLCGTTVAPMLLNGVKRLPPTPALPDLGPITSPTDSPYFVSAGPDGNFLTADDNVFSFGPAAK